MLRPEQMSKVSVTGSKRVIDDVIETAYEHHSLHVSDYDGDYDGFQPGSSLEGAEEVNEKLVTVRSLESTLGVDEADAGPRGVLDDAELDAELDEVRERVNDLNDRRDEIRNEIRDLDDEISRLEPFADLGIELDLLRGYDSLEVVVGEASESDVSAALDEADGIEAYEVFAGTSTVAVFAHPAEGAEEGVLKDALVGVDISILTVPDSGESPATYVEELEQRKRELESKRSTVESELEQVKTEAAGFLLRAEEQLTIEAQKKEAPLSFATTENAFVAEGWIPTDTYDEFAAALNEAVGDHVEVEEVERAEFTHDGDHHSEAVHDDADAEAATDGGHAVGEEEPPVVQRNGRLASPFETLVQGFGRPKYSEFDPTWLLLLTFPLMFGFMISDMGYGILYVLIGYYVFKNYDGALRSIGEVSIWAGVFTFLFGIYYGFDLFGEHMYPFLGFESWAMTKGLSPGYTEWALAWLVMSVLFGILHLNLGYVLSFAGDVKHHGLTDAVFESGSWILMLNGIWIAIFSQLAGGVKPDFLFDSIGLVTLGAVEFAGFSETVGWLGVGAALVGAVMLAKAEPAELPEALETIAHVVSYARIMAVLIAKGGMAVAVNLLAFGAYVTDGGEGSIQFMFTPSALAEAQQMAAAGEVEIIFAGMTTAFESSAIGLLALAAGIVVAIIGHIVVLLLGITAAGIQGIRLEYVEFFGKFYDGGGRQYVPFGYDRKYTASE